MADEKPEQEKPAEEAKKDTVRINLPPGMAGRGPAGPTPPPGAKIISPGAPASPEEAKRETAVLGRPVEVPKPKKDTSRVQVVAPKPSTGETPRPSVKLRRDEPSPVSTPTTAVAAPAPVAASVMAAEPSGADLGLSVVAMVLSVVLAGYLAWLAFG